MKSLEVITVASTGREGRECVLETGLARTHLFVSSSHEGVGIGVQGSKNNDEIWNRLWTLVTCLWGKGEAEMASIF